MTDDDRLEHLLRSAFPPASDREPSRDLWPLVASRMQARMGWSWLDISLAALVTLVLLLFPGWLSLLAYHFL